MAFGFDLGQKAQAEVIALAMMSLGERYEKEYALK
jgi:hypothetical protein